MILDNAIDKYIGQKLLEQNAQNDHKSSGKLSASMLGWPLQWQILKSLGIKQPDKDEYTLRKFLRGKQIEEWLIGEMQGVKETQKFAEYRGAIGYIDALVDTQFWDFKNGVIPAEIKSTTNLKFKKIVREGADRSHKLQAGFYALAENSDKFAVVYVASDDLRVQTYIYETASMKDEIDQIIDRFNEQMKIGVPVFEPAEKWQANPIYNNYPDWSELNQEEINKKVAIRKETLT